MTAYYNEIDAGAAAWLKRLIAAGKIPAGDVDERSIADVQGSDLDGYTQCHFFAGIGGWPYALQLAGWPVDREVWTGSCPCQPFSAAGKRKGTSDQRHLWPQFRRLIAERKPATVFGEQVASPLGRDWLAGVRLEMEELAYGVGSADLCAASVGAPHIRQRLFWVADAQYQSARSGEQGIKGEASEHGRDRPSIDSLTDRLPDAGGSERNRRSEPERQAGVLLHAPDRSCECGCSDGLSNHQGERCREEGAGIVRSEERPSWGGSGFWSDFEIIPFRDGKFRRIEPGTFPLADGFPGRVGLIEGYGNAIVPQLAAEFVKAFLEAVA